jgi:hypothetical protein
VIAIGLKRRSCDGRRTREENFWTATQALQG